MAVPDELLEIMICLECGGRLADRGEALVCLACGLHYPVREGIPVMLAEEAYRPAEEEGS
ncbi:MAG TPA: Trm112 family protein [Gemmatimonadales bacterium]|nr:Trm112 family protein [Gemmatimonadales bacterium]